MSYKCKINTYFLKNASNKLMTLSFKNKNKFILIFKIYKLSILKKYIPNVNINILLVLCTN